MTTGAPAHAPQHFEVLSEFLERVLAQSYLDLRYTVEERPPGERPELVIEFSGGDVNLLREHRGELLLALEHLAAKTLRLEPEEHDRLSFEAGGFKANRDRALNLLARDAERSVRQTGKAFHFGPMNSRERRMLHLALTAAGLHTQSEGDGPLRHLVVYPSGGPPAT